MKIREIFRLGDYCDKDETSQICNCGQPADFLVETDDGVQTIKRYVCIRHTGLTRGQLRDECGTEAAKYAKGFAIRHKYILAGLNFAEVCEVMDWSNRGSYLDEEWAAFEEKFLFENEPYVLMATHSAFGSDRAWQIREGETPLYFEEPSFNGGWFVFVDGDVDWLYCMSGTSTSSLTAQLQHDGSWEVALEVPADADGDEYRGAYWQDFFALHTKCSPF